MLLACCVILGEHPPLSGMKLGNGIHHGPSSLDMLWTQKKRQSEFILTPHPPSVLSRLLVPSTAGLVAAHTQRSAPSCRGLLCRTRQEGYLLRRACGGSVLNPSDHPLFLSSPCGEAVKGGTGVPREEEDIAQQPPCKEQAASALPQNCQQRERHPLVRTMAPAGCLGQGHLEQGNTGNQPHIYNGALAPYTNVSIHDTMQGRSFV